MPFLTSLPDPAQATPRPAPGRARPRRGSRLLAALLILIGLSAAAVGGFYVGVASHEVPIWDPLWMRAYLGQPLDTSLPQAGPWVAGYYVDYDQASLRTLEIRAPHLDQVISFSYNVLADGRITGRDPEILRGITSPGKLVLLFLNDKFSPQVANDLLQSPEARQNAIAGILAKVERFDAAGVQIDFEGVPPARRADLTAFIAELAAALGPRGRTLSMAVPAKTHDNPNNSWNGAFDYEALARHLDYLYIMAYDEHWRGGEPGPVASLPWVEQVVRYAISVMPTSKVLLGVPGYGYDWGPDGGRAFGSKYMVQRLARLGAESQWDPIMGEVVARYTQDGQTHVVWYPDERSLAAKLRLARLYNLKGIALWRLGFESDEAWIQMGAFRSGQPLE